jgi:TonB family protein
MTTMIADPPPNTTMGVGFDANRTHKGDSAAWKQAIGTKQVPARLALLPESKPGWDRIGISALSQLAILGFLLLLPLIFPESLKTALNYGIVEIAQPMTMVPVAPPPPKIRPKVAPPTPKPEVVEPVKLNPKQPHVFITPKVLQPKLQKVEAKAPDLVPVLEAAKIDTDVKGPKRPKDDVKVGSMSSGSAAPATLNLPVNKVQTGGFGGEHGLAGKSDPNKAANVNRAGSVLLPVGPGYGNGTGGATGARGTVASTGFGNGTANPPPGGGKKGTVVAGGFADQSVATETTKKKTAAGGPADTPVEILGKPRPEYTTEGRSLKIEGDVVIDLVFLANGSVQISHVVSGLGHGLDESAIRAAQQIHFKPAKLASQPVDFPARVRIEFRLAY